MIDHFTQADEDYGRRVKEGIEMKMKEMKEMKDVELDKVPGRESGKTRYGQGSLNANKAADEASKKGHEADPY